MDPNGRLKSHVLKSVKISLLKTWQQVESKDKSSGTSSDEEKPTNSLQGTVTGTLRKENGKTEKTRSAAISTKTRGQGL